MEKENSGFGPVGLRVAIAVAGLLGAQAAFAQFVSVGGTIRLDNGPGAGPGGEFIVTVLSGGSGLSPSFNTFCVERNEFFSYGQTLRVDGISNGAISGGAGGPNPDPISNQTAWLYAQFRSGSLGGYDYNVPSLRTHDADALQNTIWYLENEISSIGSGLSSSEAIQANSWLAAANSAVDAGWTNTNVAVLNLWRQDSQGNFTIQAQDQLYITPIPEPETYMMLLAGLGLMGFVARRRQRGLAA